MIGRCDCPEIHDLVCDDEIGRVLRCAECHGWVTVRITDPEELAQFFERFGPNPAEERE